VPKANRGAVRSDMRVLQEVEFVNSASRIPLREVPLPVGNSTHNSVHRVKKVRESHRSR